MIVDGHQPDICRQLANQHQLPAGSDKQTAGDELVCQPFCSVLKWIIKLDVRALPEASGTDSQGCIG